ncbi:MAG: phosphate ABC transporter permease subunit PstC [Fimbriimonadaceae bacterium]|nr:phosphate ABC transporter permease subunit PstC [Fimbriimonadaceae bacterium]QYK55777.1 MAG: phosphate ABC transporter permease subunit PstC [Fimbriimonadaceae bacterium]
MVRQRLPANKLTKAVSRQSLREDALTFVCLLAAMVSVATTIAIVGVLGVEAFAFFAKSGVSVGEFLTGTVWTPTFANPQFGVLPLINGTMLITVGAMVIALPLGLASGIFLSEYASPKLRRVLKPLLELLAGVPTVVFGFFALFQITPFLRSIFPSVEVFNAASGCIVVGVMTLPLVTTLCDDAINAVPRSLREGGLALGATKFEVTRNITLRAALGGIAASFILAVSRAVGETMAVTLAAGQTPKMTLNLGESIATMTAYIVQISKGDTPAGSVEYLTLYAVGATLFVITFLLNVLARRIVRRYRFAY